MNNAFDQEQLESCILTRDELIEKLKTNVLRISYIDSKGVNRVGLRTLKENLLPERKEGNSERVENIEIINTYDLEVNGWRSLRYDSIQSIVVIS